MRTVGRTCGDCVVCCTLPRISELKKPRCSNCVNLTLERTPGKGEMLLNGTSDKNCMIFDSRPTVCEQYSCLWLQGFAGDDDRPDKSLVMFDMVNAPKDGFMARMVSPDTMPRRLIQTVSEQTGMAAHIVGFYDNKVAAILPVGVG